MKGGARIIWPIGESLEKGVSNYISTSMSIRASKILGHNLPRNASRNRVHFMSSSIFRIAWLPCHLLYSFDYARLKRKTERVIKRWIEHYERGSGGSKVVIRSNKRIHVAVLEGLSSKFKYLREGEGILSELIDCESDICKNSDISAD